MQASLSIVYELYNMYGIIEHIYLIISDLTKDEKPNHFYSLTYLHIREMQ